MDRLMTSVFGAHQLAQIHKDIEAIVDALETKFREAKHAYEATDIASWSLALVRAPLADDAITTDTEVLATSEERVMSAREFDELAERKAAEAARRAAIVASADSQHRDLRV